MSTNVRRPVVNIADLEVMPLAAMSGRAGGANPPERFGGGIAPISMTIGAHKLGYNLSVIAAGKCLFPRHNHRVNEEMFFVVEGEGEIRIGEDRHAIRAGDVIACPPGGAETAHQIVNTSDRDLRILAVSTQESPEICEYPDSGKFGISARFAADAEGKPQGFRFVGRDGLAVDYWDGE